MQLRHAEPTTTAIDASFATLTAPTIGLAGHYDWRGASGATYPHMTYGLLACPAPASGSYVLARRNTDGTRNVLAAGAMPSRIASLNLAAIRREAARLGANEVHLAMLGGDVRRSTMAAFDISAFHLGHERAETIAALN